MLHPLIVDADELGFVHRQLQIEDVVAGGEEGDAAGLRAVEIGIDAQHHLLVEGQHLRLVLGDVGLQIPAHLDGEAADDLVHQLAHHVAHLVRGVGDGEILLGEPHAQHVALVQLHGGGGGEVDHHQTGKTAIEQHEAADIRLEAGLADPLHHAGKPHLTHGRGTQNVRHRVAQAEQHILCGQYGIVIGSCHYHGTFLNIENGLIYTITLTDGAARRLK